MAWLMDPQVQIKLIDIAWNRALAKPGARADVDQALKDFDKIYKALSETVSGETKAESK